MNNILPATCDNSPPRRFAKTFWIKATILSIPIWVFVWGFLYVEALHEAKDINAAGAWGTLVGIVALPLAVVSALFIVVLVVMELKRFPPQKR